MVLELPGLGHTNKGGSSVTILHRTKVRKICHDADFWIGEAAIDELEKQVVHILKLAAANAAPGKKIKRQHVADWRHAPYRENGIAGIR